MVQVLPLHSFTYCISCLVKQHTTIYYCFFVKRITLCICVCSSSFSSHFSASLIWNIGEFGAKIFYHRRANAVQLFVPIKRIFFGSIFFQNNCSKGEFCRSYLINIATCSFAYHEKWHYIVIKNLSTMSKS